MIRSLYSTFYATEVFIETHLADSLFAGRRRRDSFATGAAAERLGNAVEEARYPLSVHDGSIDDNREASLLDFMAQLRASKGPGKAWDPEALRKPIGLVGVNVTQITSAALNPS